MRLMVVGIISVIIIDEINFWNNDVEMTRFFLFCFVWFSLGFFLWENKSLQLKSEKAAPDVRKSRRRRYTGLPDIQQWWN